MIWTRTNGQYSIQGNIHSSDSSVSVVVFHPLVYSDITIFIIIYIEILLYNKYIIYNIIIIIIIK